VLDAISASSDSSSSSVRKIGPLTSGSSKTASITASDPARSARLVWNVTRSISARAEPSSIFPRETARSTDVLRRERERSSAACSGSKTRTRAPARAADSAIPEPMNPAPTTPMSPSSVMRAR